MPAWVVFMAWLSLATIVGSLGMAAFGNTQQRQQGLQNIGTYNSAAVPFDTGASSRGVGVPQYRSYPMPRR